MSVEPPDGVTIRDADRADLETLVELNCAMARETEGHDLATDVLRRGIGRVLSGVARGKYLVAEEGGRVVACLMATSEWSDWHDGWYRWIQSVYVRPEVRGRGIYTAMHAIVRAEALAAGDVIGIRLYVSPGNTGAQATYRSLGLEKMDYLLFEERFGKE